MNSGMKKIFHTAVFLKKPLDFYFIIRYNMYCCNAGVMELADVTDSKSVDGDIVWVRVPPPAPNGRRVSFETRRFSPYDQ